MVCIQGVHHNPDFWPEPLVYKPERFLETIAPYTFLPFVDGPRMCLGQFLALLESKIVLSMILYSYDFTVTNPEDAGKKHAYMVPIIPATGHYMKINDRKI
jgi:beta-ring hydroxylase